MPLDDATAAKMEGIKNTWSSQGKRLILLARKVVPEGGFSCLETAGEFESEVTRHISSELILVGMVKIVDPPRPEISSVMSTLRGAGIRVFMVCTKSSVEIKSMADVSRSLGTSLSLLKQLRANAVPSQILQSALTESLLSFVKTKSCFPSLK